MDPTLGVAAGVKGSIFLCWNSGGVLVLDKPQKVEIFQRKVVENNVLKMRNLAISSQTVFYFEANDDVVFDLDDESPISYKNGLIRSVNFRI